MSARHHFITLGGVDFICELGRHQWFPLGRTDQFFRTLAEPGIEVGTLNPLVAEVLTNGWLMTGGDWRFRAVCWSLVRAFAASQPENLPKLAAAWLSGVEQNLRASLRSIDKRLLIETTSLSGIGSTEQATPRNIALRVMRTLREAYHHFLAAEEIRAAA